jgi:hypothetical protein
MFSLKKGKHGRCHHERVNNTLSIIVEDIKQPFSPFFIGYWGIRKNVGWSVMQIAG